VLVLAASAVMADQNFSINLATAYAADAPAGVALQKFVDDVNEKSGGSIDISLFTDGTLGNPNDNYASVASGDLDMTMAGLEGLDLYAPEYTFLDSPFLVKDWDHMTALLNSGIGDTLKARYEENGFVTLGWHKRDTRVLASDKPVNSPADVSGLKLRLPGMTVYVDTWSALNVSPTTLAMNELYTGLSTNMAEACEGGYEQMNTLKLYEVQKYILYVNYQYHPEVMTMNAAFYRSLPEEYQKVLSDAAWLFVETENKISLENAEARLEEMKQAGCDVYTPTAEERQAFIDACAQVYDHFVNTLKYFSQEELDLVKSLAEGK
jgi:tripartite ATP-independent transporter DctP family solute receptor